MRFGYRTYRNGRGFVALHTNTHACEGQQQQQQLLLLLGQRSKARMADEYLEGEQEKEGLYTVTPCTVNPSGRG
jgi:hypothetical protein